MEAEMKGFYGFRHEEDKPYENVRIFVDFVNLLPKEAHDLIVATKGYQRILKGCSYTNPSVTWKGISYNLGKESSMWRCIAAIAEDLGGYRMAMIAWMSLRTCVPKPKKMTPEEGEYLVTQDFIHYKRNLKEIDGNIERLKNLCLRKED